MALRHTQSASVNTGDSKAWRISSYLGVDFGMGPINRRILLLLRGDFLIKKSPRRHKFFARLSFSLLLMRFRDSSIQESSALSHLCRNNLYFGESNQAAPMIQSQQQEGQANLSLHAEAVI